MDEKLFFLEMNQVSLCAWFLETDPWVGPSPGSFVPYTDSGSDSNLRDLWFFRIPGPSSGLAVSSKSGFDFYKWEEWRLLGPGSSLMGAIKSKFDASHGDGPNLWNPRGQMLKLAGSIRKHLGRQSKSKEIFMKRSQRGAQDPGHWRHWPQPPRRGRRKLGQGGEEEIAEIRGGRF